jgi:hypothetical protein
VQYDGLNVHPGLVAIRIELFTAALRLQNVVLVLLFDPDRGRSQEQRLGVFVIMISCKKSNSSISGNVRLYPNFALPLTEKTSSPISTKPPSLSGYPKISPDIVSLDLAPVISQVPVPTLPTLRKSLQFRFHLSQSN